MIFIEILLKRPLYVYICKQLRNNKYIRFCEPVYLWNSKQKNVGTEIVIQVCGEEEKVINPKCRT